MEQEPVGSGVVEGEIVPADIPEQRQVQNITSSADLEEAAIPADEGRRRTAALRKQLTGAWEEVTALWRGRVWLGLGYDSWDDYWGREIGGTPPRLPSNERRDAVLELQRGGLPASAIGQVLGVHPSTVTRDVQRVDAEARASGRPSPVPATVTTEGGTQRPARYATRAPRTKPPTAVEPAFEEIFDAATLTLHDAMDWVRKAFEDPRFADYLPKLKGDYTDQYGELVDRLQDFYERLVEG